MSRFMAECPHCGEMFDDEDTWFEHGRLQAKTERLQAARAADTARIKLLEADAARYRWLRDHSQSFHTFYLSVPIWMAGVSVNQEKVDRSIGAAIALSQQGKENES